MGMTIEEAKEFLIDECDANIIAIDIINKYQKIQKIIKDWEDGRFSDAVGCLRVKAVIEDGQ